MEYEEEDIVCLFLSQTAVQMLERKVKGGKRMRKGSNFSMAMANVLLIGE